MLPPPRPLLVLSWITQRLLTRVARTSWDIFDLFHIPVVWAKLCARAFKLFEKGNWLAFMAHNHYATLLSFSSSANFELFAISCFTFRCTGDERFIKYSFQKCIKKRATRSKHCSTTLLLARYRHTTASMLHGRIERKDLLRLGNVTILSYVHR